MAPGDGNRGERVGGIPSDPAYSGCMIEILPELPDKVVGVRASGTVTLYAPRSRELVTIKVAEEHLSLPADTWRAGDEIRYYFKDPGQALRMMNVSKTRVS